MRSSCSAGMPQPLSPIASTSSSRRASPEAITDSPSWRALPWVTTFDRAIHPDSARLLPLTYAMAMVILVVSVILIFADIVAPVSLS